MWGVMRGTRGSALDTETWRGGAGHRQGREGGREKGNAKQAMCSAPPLVTSLHTRHHLQGSKPPAQRCPPTCAGPVMPNRPMADRIFSSPWSCPNSRSCGAESKQAGSGEGGGGGAAVQPQEPGSGPGRLGPMWRAQNDHEQVLQTSPPSSLVLPNGPPRARMPTRPQPHTPAPPHPFTLKHHRNTRRRPTPRPHRPRRTMYCSGLSSSGSSSVRCWWYCPIRRWLCRFTCAQRARLARRERPGMCLGAKGRHDAKAHQCWGTGP